MIALTKCFDISPQDIKLCFLFVRLTAHWIVAGCVFIFSHVLRLLHSFTDTVGDGKAGEEPGNEARFE